MDGQEQMVNEIREKYGLQSPKTFSAMLQVPRDRFAPVKHKSIAYSDGPVPIGHGQTMSQPYTVAFMTHLVLGLGESSSAKAAKGKKVLEIGTGSGYQAAVLSKLVREVYTVEIIPELAKRAEKVLKELDYNNVYVKSGSGEWGWEEHAPYDAIIVTAGVENKVPQELFDQLKVGGILVAPVGEGHDKEMIRFRKLKNGKTKKQKYGVFHFVPFVEEKAG